MTRRLMEGAEAIGILVAVTGPRSLAAHDLVELMRGAGDAATSVGRDINRLFVNRSIE